MAIHNRLVIGVIGNDIHVVANRVMARGLRMAGYQVCNLGVSNLPEDFVFSAIEHEADAVIISTLNGEGSDWVIGLCDAFSKAGREDMLLYIGGNLAVGEKPQVEIEARFLELGFNRAYHRPQHLDMLLDDLSEDLVFND